MADRRAWSASAFAGDTRLPAEGVRMVVKGSSGVTIACALLMAACFALDVVTPQLLVVAILLNVPIALASMARTVVHARIAGGRYAEAQMTSLDSER